MILGCSVRQLEDDREAGDPPPFVKRGGSIRYRVEDVRKALADLILSHTTTESKAVQARRKKPTPHGIAFASFTDYLARGSIDDVWPFIITKGRPIDLLVSLGLQIDDDEAEGRYLTQEEYFEMSLAYGRRVRSDTEGDTLRTEMDKVPPSKSTSKTPKDRF